MSATDPHGSRLDVVLGQAAPVPGRIDVNVATVVASVTRNPDADLVVFPELFLSGYDLGVVASLAISSSSAALQPLREAARRAGTAIVVGFPERDGSRVHDTALCVDSDGSYAGLVRKTHLFGAENDRFASGDSLGCVRLAGRDIAVLNCFEVEFPEVARRLAAEEPDLFVAIAANMMSYGAEHRVAIRARALENRTPLVYVNRLGRESGLLFAGGSCVVDVHGEVTVDLGANDRCTLATVPIHASVDMDLDYRHHMRPSLYGPPLA